MKKESKTELKARRHAFEDIFKMQGPVQLACSINRSINNSLALGGKNREEEEGSDSRERQRERRESATESTMSVRACHDE